MADTPRYRIAMGDEREQAMVAWAVETLAIALNMRVFKTTGERPTVAKTHEQISFAIELSDRLHDQATNECTSQDTENRKAIFYRLVIDAAHEILHHQPSPTAKG